MRPVPILLRVLLCLALALSGGAMAGHGPAVAGYAELCRDGAAVTVAVDTRGQPVDPADAGPPHCPDCLVPVAGLGAGAPAVPPRQARRRRARRPRPCSGARIDPCCVAPPARGPPSAV
jgi:hypothetical protein